MSGNNYFHKEIFKPTRKRTKSYNEFEFDFTTDKISTQILEIWMKKKQVKFLQ
jgi:hypothetical protein